MTFSLNRIFLLLLKVLTDNFDLGISYSISFHVPHFLHKERSAGPFVNLDNPALEKNKDSLTIANSK